MKKKIFYRIIILLLFILTLFSCVCVIAFSQNTIRSDSGEQLLIFRQSLDDNSGDITIKNVSDNIIYIFSIRWRFICRTSTRESIGEVLVNRVLLSGDSYSITVNSKSGFSCDEEDIVFGYTVDWEIR